MRLETSKFKIYPGNTMAIHSGNVMASTIYPEDVMALTIYPGTLRVRVFIPGAL